MTEMLGEHVYALIDLGLILGVILLARKGYRSRNNMDHFKPRR